MTLRRKSNLITLSKVDHFVENMIESQKLPMTFREKTPQVVFAFYITRSETFDEVITLMETFDEVMDGHIFDQLFDF